VGIKAGVACGYCNLSEHLRAAGRFAEALDAAGSGLAIAREIGNPFWITGGLNGVAAASLAMGDAAPAARCSEECFDLAVERGFEGRAAFALHAALEAMHALGDGEGEARMRAKGESAGVTPATADRA
jgi:hypothetical protein